MLPLAGASLTPPSGRCSKADPNPANRFARLRPVACQIIPASKAGRSASLGDQRGPRDPPPGANCLNHRPKHFRDCDQGGRQIGRPPPHPNRYRPTVTLPGRAPDACWTGLLSQPLNPREARSHHARKTPRKPGFQYAILNIMYHTIDNSITSLHNIGVTCSTKIKVKILLTLFTLEDMIQPSSLNMKTHRNIQTQTKATSGLRRSGVFCTYWGISLRSPNMLGEAPDKLVRRHFTN